MGAAVGGNLLNKLNLPGLGGVGGASVLASMQGLGKAAGGYQPKMFGTKVGGDSQDGGNDTNRFSGRFG